MPIVWRVGASLARITCCCLFTLIQVINAINKNISNVVFPFSDHTKLREHAATFFGVAQLLFCSRAPQLIAHAGVTSELPGTVAAGDGVAINIEAPTLQEVEGDLRLQFSRKGACHVHPFCSLHQCCYRILHVLSHCLLRRSFENNGGYGRAVWQHRLGGEGLCRLMC